MTPLFDAPTRRLVLAAGGLSLVAGLLHLYMAPEHFGEWIGYGLFFVACFVAQGANGLLLIWEGYQTKPRPAWWPSAYRAMIWTGIAGNVVLILFWAYTRFVGVPLGPAAGEKEEIAIGDLLTKTVELALVVALVGLLRYGPRVAEPEPLVSYA
ncbi:MAG: hypothetical protein QOE90_2566 [Thermoplasmata archaeon]|jgi:hypothetical protein|nr:hypothetical protein [Thermoplasmata archaeon]